MKRSKNLFAAVLLAGTLTGCGPTLETLVLSTTTSNPACDGSGVASGTGALSVGGTGGCISSITTAYENDASAIRNSSHYQFQNVLHSVNGSAVQSSSLIAGGFEYAHALNLTGAEQIIAIHDSGFNPNHIEFLDKSIAFGHGTTASTITVDSHGTGVASIAAGAAQSGSTLGAAPNASLYLSSWNDGQESSAVNEAAALGAIALNNSWGYECFGDAFGECGINDYALSFIGAAYRTALLNYAGDEGVVVFSASNEETQTQATFMAGLPALLPALEEGWLAVINLARDYDTTQPTLFDDTNVGILSSGCLESARWCIAADGTSRVASLNSNSYESATGTSFAAPRVSAAIAILSEAFPNLSTKEIRNRLIMTADNAFFATDTAQIQTLSFQNGLSHDYHWIYGHGFIDLKSALLPIGGAVTTLSKGLVLNLETPVIRSNGASGDALQTALKKVALYATDAMGGAFAPTADALVTTYSTNSRSDRNLAILAHSTLPSIAIGASEFDTQSGIAVPFDLTSNSQMILKLPDNSSGPLGVKLRTDVPVDTGNVTLGVTALGDNSSLLGLSLGNAGHLRSAQIGLEASYSVNLADAVSLEVAGHTGTARSETSGIFDGIDDVTFGSIGVRLSQENAFSSGDRLSLFANRPTAISSGSARTSLSLADASGGAQDTQVDIPLSPSNRETELGFEYAADGFAGENWVLQASHRFNASNIANNNVSNVLLGLRLQF